MSIYQKMGGSDKKPGKPEPAEKPADETVSEDFESVKSAQKALNHPSYEELEDLLNETEAKAEDYKNQLLRNHADLENIRKRAEKDINNAHKYGLERLINELLPVIDNFERALSIDSGDNEFAQRMHEGLAMTLNLFLKALEKVAVKPIDPLQQPFNPELHQAISTQEDSTVPANTVVKVLQKGYQLHDRLIRPALVIVSTTS